MKLYLLLQTILLLLAGQCFSQTDSFDVFTYTSPEFFVKSELPSRLQFTMSNADGNFCTITLYKSQHSKEEATKNSISQWNEQVVKRLTRASKKPGRIMTGQLLDGWTSTLAIGNFYHHKKKCVVMLNSFGKDQTSACITFAFTDPLFKGAVENFSRNLHLKNQ
ncbi:MAG TPA: hypothetical protein VF487_15775 [Chitinophagaceae bacterium]